MALLALAIAEFMAAVLLKAWSFVSTLAGVLLVATSSCSASKADCFALPAKPVVRLALKAVRLDRFAAMLPSAAAKSAAKA